MRVREVAVWEAFLAVAKHSSFSKAASHLRISVAQLSKRIARLESDLGVQLFRRTTRSVSLTNEGTALVPKIATVLDDLNGIESGFETDQSIVGTVRMTAVPFVAHRLLLPVLAELAVAHPQLKVELDVSESMMNILEQNFDLAVRIQEPSDSSMVYRKLAANELVICASPRYLKNRRRLSAPDDLRYHDLLYLRAHQRCAFAGTDLNLGNFSNHRHIVCENGWFLTELALQGFGVLVRSKWDVQEHLKSGALVQVLKKFPLGSFGNIYAVIPSRRYLAPRVRVVLDSIVRAGGKWSDV